MPELPEVETIRRQLAPQLEGRTIVEAQILDPRWTRPDPPAAVEHELRGAAVERIGRAGKYLIWSLSGERFLLQHLRMTGTLLYDPGVPPPQADHAAGTSASGSRAARNLGGSGRGQAAAQVHAAGPFGP